MVRASAGAATFAPTAVMRPSRTTTVPRSIVAPVPGTMRAFVIAYAVGTLRSRWTPICASAAGGAIAAPASSAAAAAAVAGRERRVSIATAFLADGGGGQRAAAD